MKPSRIRAIRAQLALTQAEFGELLGFSREYISKLESGQKVLKDTFRRQILGIFKMALAKNPNLDEEVREYINQNATPIMTTFAIMHAAIGPMVEANRKEIEQERSEKQRSRAAFS